MSMFSDIFFGGLFQGSLYAMMAVGLALVWTTIGVFNFSHGVFMMLGAYFAWQLVAFGLPVVIAFPLAVIVMAGAGWILQASVVRPLIGRPNIVLVVVITTLAAGSLMENGALTVWGPRSKQLPSLIEGNTTIAGVGVSLHQIAIIVITPLILAALWSFLNRTRLGLALRAVAQNEDASQLVGLNVTALYGLAFAIAASLAGLAGIFMGGYRFMNPSMGADPLLKALIVVVFGGISSISGPIFAAYLIGFFEAASNYYFGLYWTPALLFLVLIATLMVRPEGIFASRSRGLA
ncbi:MAG: branched-chain amino acid ABC transporter permease [Mesorhizobium sp.]|jgi:branched-chain amino acid transport system permease protein|uniref:Branched-chain amino acid ABC transporter permease n=2 Tax=Mesorhizobium TaxID=68287 RepID=A0AB36R9K9_9HYPH|nr:MULTISPECIES: branched-chain amino acid ABC transporter permease [Mesorhizobium]RUU28033.1 branched-chain amino acid ABC transporter permease [Mesorhizobium sp. M6A.T.Ca.TU.002.02.2.1]AZO68090.1 branched-chain amino acid ABC transporter permease [Mesorhizobium sp. M6A.T.Cr.TU.016.01.1.1]PAQ01482.1 branched-chain amino acid ABC transporter permease [Mesorhizobium mediterraneum]RUU26128.1 branched-chain amino acid ABC transporter permease [Mesorhizobium sp. M6A.T.Ce.TU.016.01.1.1]RUU43747.1 b